MNRLVSGAVALIAAGWTASAQAADLPYGSHPPYTVNQPLNVYSWAGPYLGANLGYAWGSVDHNPTKPSGFSGGAQGGYNWQTGPWVFGVEGDIQATGANDTFAPWKFSNPWFGTVRGRAGYALSNILFYGTGGLTYSSGDEARTGFAGTSPRTGWTVGGGVEYAPGKQWSLGLEYLYADFGKSAQSRSNFSTGGSPNDDHSQILRGRLNYRFGWDGLQK